MSTDLAKTQRSLDEFIKTNGKLSKTEVVSSITI